jgi:DNA polymerase-3 subunit gamma/tau
MFAQTRAGKKKWLTDRVEILPFPNQSLRKNTQTQKVNQPVVKQSYVKEELPPKVLTEPTGNIGSSHVSIKQILEEQKAQEVSPNQDDLPREGFSKEQVKMYWKQFAFQMKENGMETFYHALIKREPHFLEEEKFGLEVDNQIQIDYINPILGNFIDFLRKNLNNYQIEITLILTDNPNEEVKYLTGKDKFNALARRNPNLHTLKNLFNLDIEF